MFVLDEMDMPRLAITVTPSLGDPEIWVPEGYKTKDFSLVVIASSPNLKRAKVLFNVPASVFASGPISLPPEDLEALGGGRNLRLTVALCLTSDRPQQPGTPFWVGHWLASKTFTVKAKSPNALFDVRTRSDEEWIAAGYPAKTLYAVEYTTGIAEDPEGDDPSSIAVAHVHIDAFNRMAGQRMGELMEPIMAADMLAQVIEQSSHDWETITSPGKRSPLTNLMKKFEGTKLETLSGMRESIKAPAMLRAIIQERLSVLRAITTGPSS